MTLLLDPATETARAMTSALMDGLVRDHGTPTTMREESGSVVLEWHRPGEVYRVTVDEYGGLCRQLIPRRRLPEDTVAKLRDVIAVNEKVPDENFDMGTFKREEDCGTVACLIGNWILARPDILLTFQRDGDCFYPRLRGLKTHDDGSEAIEKYIDISQSAAIHLFYDLSLSRVQALARLRAFIDSDGEIPGNRLPGELSRLPAPPEGVCQPSDEEEPERFDGMA